MINPALYSHGFQHGTNLLVVMKAPRVCPVCGWACVLWISHRDEGRDSCLGCAERPKRVEVRP